MKVLRLFTAAAMITVLFACTPAEQAENEMAPEGPYVAEWESLKQHEAAPEWFQDAKFGIYFHWGVYSVPAYGSEWYPRFMHIKDSSVHKHHVEKYGDPSEFGYHDFVPMFKAENFDAEQWAALFDQAGAKFAGPVAEHHDGFAMWASDLTPWNAADKGPGRDITGEIAKAIRARGMKLFVSFHHARNNQHQKTVDGYLRWTGHYEREPGWPTVSEDPELRMLYGNLPRSEFLDLWQKKLEEVIDKYQPEVIWFDSWLDEIPVKDRQNFSAYYLNRAAEWGKDVVITRKQGDLPLDYTVHDIEKGRMKDVTGETWLADDTISKGSWCYTENLTIKSSATVLHSLIDIVSKNGVLVLNVSPMANGSIPENQQNVLKDMGAWLEVNGEAIYSTRPWTVFGEGPTDKELPEGQFGGVTDPEGGYTAQDIRFTKSKDGSALYAIALGQPKAGAKVEIRSLTDKPDISSVSMLGSDETVGWKWSGKTLVITAPESGNEQLAVVFKIELD
jgi:alpha-L-fucosidase